MPVPITTGGELTDLEYRQKLGPCVRRIISTTSRRYTTGRGPRKCQCRQCVVSGDPSKAADTEIWICTSCGYAGCSRKDHGGAMEHWEKADHRFAMHIPTDLVDNGRLMFKQTEIWDYQQDKYLKKEACSEPKEVSSICGSTLRGLAEPISPSHKSQVGSEDIKLAQERVNVLQSLVLHATPNAGASRECGTDTIMEVYESYRTLLLHQHLLETSSYAPSQLSGIFSPVRTVCLPETFFEVTNEQLDMAVKILCARISPQKRLDPKDVQTLNVSVEDKILDPAGQVPRPCGNVVRVNPSWLCRPPRHISRRLSYISGRIMRSPFLPLLAFSSHVPVANALSEVSSGLESLLAVPLSPYDLASTLFTCLIYTIAVVFIIHRLETRTQSIGLSVLLELLAYICSLGAYDTRLVPRDVATFWLLSLFLGAVGILPLLSFGVGHSTPLPAMSQSRRNAPPFRSYCSSCGHANCGGCGLDPGNEDQV